MDDKTVQYYDNHAPELVKRYNSAESPLSSLAPILFKQGEKLLDTGCGSGRDISLLLDLGYDAYGAEPSDSLRTLAIEANPKLKDRIFKSALPHLQDDLNDTYDHVILSAVIMHIPDSKLFESAYSLRSVLKEGGMLVISHCTSREAPLNDNRDDKGRLFMLRSSEQIQLLFEGLGFVKRHCFKSSDKLNRSGVEWETLVLEYTGDLRSESVDRIEHIINTDRKTATYKLALLRSLCEIAQTSPHCAGWTTDGKVKVPIKYISDKWIEYYLPMMTSDVFVPNNRGEKSDSSKPIAFRKLLTELSKSYNHSEGLAQFIDDRARNKFTTGNKVLYKKTISEINKAIKNGPVVHTSGNIFSYAKADKTIVMEGALWREMVLLGHWIEDSLILKWANLINTFSKSTVEFPVNQALAIMLKQPDMERRIGPARKAYETQDKLTCVWSNKSVTKKNLAIDHAIPFSLRHDNSLWNLLPSDRAVNLNKSDMLPEEPLLLRQKDAIIYNWQLLYSSQPDLFSSETCRFMGINKLPEKSWETNLFNRFFETIEYTAYRRGVERWGC